MMMIPFEWLRSTLFQDKLVFVGDHHDIPIGIGEQWQHDDVAAAAAARLVRGGGFVTFLGTFGMSSWSSSLASLFWFWVQLSAIVLLLSIQNAAIAVFIYKFIIVHPKAREDSIAPKSFLFSYLLGYGVVCPLLAMTPFGIIRLLDLRNRALLVASASSSVLLFFRCLEAMHGTAPAFAVASTKEKEEGRPSSSLTRFVLYYVATIQFEFDPQTGDLLKCTRSWLLGQLQRFLILYVQVSALFSVLIPRDFQLVPVPFEDDHHHQWRNHHNMLIMCVSYAARIAAHLLNNLCMAILTSLCLDVGATGMGLATGALTGYRTVQLNDRPLSLSTSPSDFWGRRWNTLVGTALKRAVFVPLRKHWGMGRAVSALATFAASGIMHEYVIAVMVCRERRPLLVHQQLQKGSTILLEVAPYWGRHSLFFLWNGLLLVAEEVVASHSAARQWMDRNVPSAGLARTATVVLTALPVSHLFTSVYVETGFYRDFSIGFPRLFLVQ